jgi:hypothetical protein
MDVRDSLLLIELDKGGEKLGPLFEEPRRRLQEDPGFRRAWSQYQAIRALAWEAAPALDERLVRQGLQASRRHDVERRLARATGSQDLARELLLDPSRVKRSGLPVWVSFLLLVGAIGLGWTAFGPKPKGPEPGAPSFAAADGANTQADAEAPLAFEFPAESQAGAALEPQGQPPASDETRAENADARRARRLLQEQLHHNDPPTPAPATVAPTATVSAPKPTPPTGPPQDSAIAPPALAFVATEAPSAGPVPTMAPTHAPTPAPTALPTAAPARVPTPLPTVAPTSLPTHAPALVPTVRPTQVPTRAPTAVPTRAATAVPTTLPTHVSSIELLPEETLAPAAVRVPAVSSAKLHGPKKLEGMAVEAALSLSGPQLPAQATLSLPEAGAVDLRLFDMRGRLVRRYAEGDQGPGRWRYSLSATDEQGRPLAKGSYYLRVITRWFSKVEALEQP